MKAEEFVNLVNEGIAPESGLRPITVKDLRCWTEMGFFKYSPQCHQEYYRSDLEKVIALLRFEAGVIRRTRSSPAQPARVQKTEARGDVLQRGVVQVICCSVSNLIEEQLIIQGLKDTNLIGSAGQIAVNFHPFSRGAVDIPSIGAQAKEGDLLIIECDDSGGLELEPVVTPLGKREFTADDTWIRTLSGLNPERKPELLLEIQLEIPPKTAKRIKFPWPPEKSEALTSKDSMSQKQFPRSLFTFPIFVPVVAINGVPATTVESVYVTPNGRRTPPLCDAAFLLSRLYPAFLNTDGDSLQEIVTFMANYGLTLRFRSSPASDPTGYFRAEQQKMREVLTEAYNGKLRFADIQGLSPAHEDALVEQDFIEALLATPDYADYISERRRAYGAQEQKSRFLQVRRYYSWLDYMWAEILEDIGQGLIPRLCKGGCGKILSPSAEHQRGRKKEYCPDCERT